MTIQRALNSRQTSPLAARRIPAVVTTKVPFAVRKRGGRKVVLAPDGAPVPPLADSTLVKAIARVPVAEDAGVRAVRYDQGDRAGGEDQSVIC